MPEAPVFEPSIHMPEAEAAALEEAYRNARVIGEYGSGGSTALAARDCTARIRSIESDAAWVAQLQGWLDENAPEARGRVDLRHCDIGPTGAWGTPTAARFWRKFWTYPYALWAGGDFDPDLVLIDGRFRTACLAATMLHCRQPLMVLFDDYTPRKHYHVVEELLPKPLLIGRMACFEVAPGLISREDMLRMIPWFFSAR